MLVKISQGYRVFSHTISIMLLFAGMVSAAIAQTIQNPFYTDPAWKLWYKDQTPISILSPPLLTNWLFPDDADTVANPGLFLDYRNTDWPQRKYAGHWYDTYISLDCNNPPVPGCSPHSFIQSNWVGDFGNSVSIRSPNTLITGHYDDLPTGRSTAGLRSYGTVWTSQSTTGLGHGQTTSFNAINILERDYYFANILRSGPTHTSYMEHSHFYSTDKYDALVPVYYNSIGSSGSETRALTKLAVAGGYLPRPVKPELLRNGLFTSAMLYLWKASLPYDVPYEHEMRHRLTYMSYGDGTRNDYGGSNRSQVSTISYYYNPTKHLANMVAMAKQMYVTPPVVILKHIATLSGTEKSVNKSAIRIHQTASEIAQVRISTEDSFDLQGLPISFRWKVLNGNKNTTVEYEGNSTYLITVPADDNLTQGRTVIALTASNGFHDSNIATVNVFRTAGAANNLRVTPVTGLSDRAILPGETVSLSAHSSDPEGYPVTFSKWEGIGELDGNVFTWNADPSTEEGSYPVHIIASDGSAGNGYSGGEAKIEISNTVAEISASTSLGMVPLTVNFSSAGSRDKDSNNLNYLWNFDDGTTSTTVNPSHQFTQPGIFKVSLTVTGPLGSHVSRQVVEVKNNWNLALNNGWDATNGIDTGIWNATGTAISTSGNAGERLTISGGANGVPVGISSVQSFTTPLYIESVFRRPSQGARPNTGFEQLGSLLGSPVNSVPVAYQELDYSIGHPSQADPAVWVIEPVGAHIRWPVAISTVRLYVEDDPNNPGKIRYRGYLDADIGRYFIQFDNQDPTEDWFTNTLGITSEDSGAIEVWRYQVWTPTGTVTGPEINILGEQSQNVFDRFRNVSETNKAAVLQDNGLDFGHPGSIGASVTRSYTIDNQGDTLLNLTDPTPYINITGTNAADFVLSSTPSPSIAPGSSTTFSITFTPGGSGIRSADISIPSDDPDEASYTFRVRGSARTPQEINIEGNGINIAIGDTTPNETDHSDFSTINRNTNRERTFLIQNHGLDNLGSISASISGVNGADFVITQTPRSTLSGLESTALKVTFTPGGLGLRSANVEIISDDADEPLYTFAIQGNGIDGFITDKATISVPENGDATLSIKLSAAPLAPITVTATMANGGHMDTDVTIQSGGTLNFDAGNWNTFQSITFTAGDDPTDTVSGIAMVMLNANSSDFLDAHVIITELDDDTNARPVANDQSITVDEDCSIDISLTGLDGNANDSLTFSIANNPANGTLTGTTPTLTYQGNLDYNGLDSFMFTASDGLVTSDPGTVSIAVTAINDSLDTDGDGLTDQLEKCTYNTLFNDSDTDNDGLNDGDEVNIHSTDPLNTDTDADGMPDGWEFNNGLNPLLDDSADDLDSDSLDNLTEFTLGTNPNNTESDGDGLSDGDEINIYGTNPAIVDTDGDGLGDGDEVNIHSTDPTNTDTDADGMPDGWELDNGLNPLVDDSTGDLDGDGLNNLSEYTMGTDPNNTDSDGDGLSDGDEVNIHGTNPAIVDTDGDGLDDGDEINIHSTDPTNIDTDADGMPDGWELDNGLNPLVDDSTGDLDGDGLNNLSEYTLGTDPNNTDSDGDGLSDGDEANIHGTNPAILDTDGDGLSDGDEVNIHGTNPLSTDTDSDNMPDNWEITNGLNPLIDDSAGDPDADGLVNLVEYISNTDPNNPDTDGDGLNDGDEVNVHGTNPINADTDDDRLNDGEELNVYGTDPLSGVDTDNDGMADDWENVFALNPNDDVDGLTDTDLDGIINYLEFWRDTDPNDNSSVPLITTYHVDTNTCNAAGSPDGSPGNPYCSIQAGINGADGGDTVLVSNGAYSATFFEALNITKPIILIAAPGQQPVFSLIFGTVNFSGIHWGTVSGFEFVGGIGVKITGGRNLLFENNVVRNQPFGLPAFVINTTDATIRNNLIRNNTFALGVEIQSLSTNVLFESNTVYANATGIDILGGGQVTIKNTIVWGNTVETGVGITPAALSYSLVGDPAFTGVNGNLSGDPLFVNTAGGDLHLQPSSIAIDSGDPSDSYNNEPENNGNRINMGAYGNTVEAAIGIDTDGDGLTNQNEQCYDEDCGNYDPYDPIANPDGTDLDYTLKDTDGDGHWDNNEIIYGSNPINELSLPSITPDGDVNLDGQINAADILLAQRYVLGLITLSQTQIDHGDLYPVGGGDGLLDLSDVLLITQQALQ